MNARTLHLLDSTGLGHLPSKLGARRCGDICLASPGGTASLPLQKSVALSRSALDNALVAEAQRAGAHVLTSHTAHVGPCRPEGRLVTLTAMDQTFVVTARVVIIAAGLGHGGDGRMHEASRQHVPNGRIGAGAIYESGPEWYRPGRIYMAIGRHGYVGLVRLEDGSLDVAAALEPDWVRARGGIAGAVAGILRESDLPWTNEAATWKGTPVLTQQAPLVADERMFVIGDAAGYVEPFTGEGIAWALQSAQMVMPLVVKAVERWDQTIARDWMACYRAVLGRRQRTCRFVCQALRRPWLVTAALRLLAYQPGLANPLLNHLNGTRL